MKGLISFCVLIGVAFTGFASVGVISASGCEGAQPPESSYELEPGVWLTYYYACIDGEWVQQERIEDKRATATTAPTTQPTATTVQATDSPVATQAPPATVQVTATVQATATEPVATTQATETAPTPAATGIAQPAQPTIAATDVYTDIVVTATVNAARPGGQRIVPTLAPPATAETRNNFEATPAQEQPVAPQEPQASLTPTMIPTAPAALATPAPCPFMDDNGCGRG